MRRIAILAALLLVAAAPAPVFADPMDSAAGWPAEGSDSVPASSRAAGGGAVEMRYDYGRVSGYAFIRRKADADAAAQLRDPLQHAREPAGATTCR